MWQITWMLSLLPEVIWTWLFIVSILVVIATRLTRFIPIPALSAYGGIIRPVAIAFALLAVYEKGGADVANSWKEKIAEMQAKVDQAEIASANTNKEIETKVVTKTKVIKEKGDTIIQYVDRVVTQDKEVIKFVEKCPIPDKVVKTLNAAALNQEIKEELKK